MALAATQPVPFIAPDALLVFLVQIAVILFAAIALGALARRLGLPAVAGEIVAGVALGPSILGLVWPALHDWIFPAAATGQNLVDAIGQLGVVLLVGLAGMELDLGFVRRKSRTVASVGIFAFVIPFAAGVGAGFLIPASMRAEGKSLTLLALLLGIGISVSAVPVITKILSEMGYLHRNIGQLILLVGTVNDAAAWALLSIVSVAATTSLRAGNIALTLISTAGVLIVSLMVLRPAAKPVLNWIEAAPSRTGYLAPLCAAFIVACAAATQALHLEAILGAFAAGMVLGPRSPKLIAPLQSVTITILAPIFLATAGLRVDLRQLADPVVAVTTVVIVILAIASKFIGAHLGARLAGHNRWEALAFGAGLNTRGAVEIVIAMTGLRIGLFSPSVYTIIVIVAVVTSVMAPPLLKGAMRRVDVTEEEEIRRDLRTPAA